MQATYASKLDNHVSAILEEHELVYLQALLSCFYGCYIPGNATANDH